MARLLRCRFSVWHAAKNGRAMREKTGTSSYHFHLQKQVKNFLKTPAVHSCSCRETRPDTRKKKKKNTQLLTVFGDGANHSNYAIVMLLPSWLNWMNASTSLKTSVSTCAEKATCDHWDALSLVQYNVSPKRSGAFSALRLKLSGFLELRSWFGASNFINIRPDWKSLSQNSILSSL